MSVVIVVVVDDDDDVAKTCSFAATYELMMVWNGKKMIVMIEDRTSSKAAVAFLLLAIDVLVGNKKLLSLYGHYYLLSFFVLRTYVLRRKFQKHALRPRPLRFSRFGTYLVST